MDDCPRVEGNKADVHEGLLQVNSSPGLRLTCRGGTRWWAGHVCMFVDCSTFVRRKFTISSSLAGVLGLEYSRHMDGCIELEREGVGGASTPLKFVTSHRIVYIPTPGTTRPAACTSCCETNCCLHQHTSQPQVWR